MAQAAMSDNASGDSPWFQLNGQDPDWSEGDGPSFTGLPSNSFGSPVMEMAWVLHYEDLYGLAFSTYLEFGENGTTSFAFDADLYFYGNEDLELEAVNAHYGDNTSTPIGISSNEAHHFVAAGDETPVFEVTWEEVLPEPPLELLQWHPEAGDYGEPANVTWWMDGSGYYEF